MSFCSILQLSLQIPCLLIELHIEFLAESQEFWRVLDILRLEFHCADVICTTSDIERRSSTLSTGITGEVRIQMLDPGSGAIKEQHLLEVSVGLGL